MIKGRSKMKESNKDYQQKISIIAQSLYLANLLLLPGLSFLVLLHYFMKHKSHYGVARIHLYRSMQLCILNGILLAVIPLIYIFISASFSAALMVTIFYFVCMHSIFVLIGMFNLSRALVSKLPIF